MLPPVSVVRIKATEQALSSLRSGILDGTLPGGSRLREVHLAKSMAVSRTPVREAIARLVTEGLVTRDELGNATVLRPILDELTEIYEIRIALESGDSVKLSGFGNFQLREKPQRPGRNPKTGEEIPITARRVVTFHASQKLKAMVEAANHGRAQAD